MKFLCDEIQLSPEAQAALEGLIDSDPPAAPLLRPATELGVHELAAPDDFGGCKATEKGRRWLKHFRLKQKYPNDMVPLAEW